MEVQIQGPMVQLQYPDAEVRSDAYMEAESVLIEDLTYIKASSLQRVYDWFSPQETPEGLCFSTASGGTTGIFETTEFQHVRLEGLDGTCIRDGDDLWVPLRALSAATGLYLLWDSTASYVSQMPDTSLIPQGVRVPILMYHEVDDETWGLSSLFVTPANMRAQLQYLQDNGYDPIFLSDLTHLEDYDKPVVLTFDDGYVGNYEELFPLLKEFNMKATVFIMPDFLGRESYLTQAQVQEMADSGLISIQSHTMSHRELATISYDDQEYEMRQSQLEIARLTGRTPYVICYPSGSFNDNTRAIAPCYYSFGLKMNGGTWITEETDYHTMERSFVSRSTGMEKFIGLLS